MPLVLMCGYPGSGKTTRALELYAHLKSIGREVVLINEECLNIDRSQGYADSTQEKIARAELKSAVERSVSQAVTVIADSLNYIKGYRYELYCLARASGTPHMVIFCDAAAEDCYSWNDTRSEGKWPSNMMVELVSRFETPNPKQRWDDPCYLIKPTDVLPLEEMANLLANNKIESAGMATQVAKVADTNYLFDIDKDTQDAVNSILEASNQSMIGDYVTVSKATKQVHLIKSITLAELRRLRRQYLTLVKQMAVTKQTHTQSTQTQVLDGFVDYINAQLNL